MIVSRILVVAALILSGCRTNAPITVWQPATMESTVGKRVAVSSVKGPKEITGPIREKMLSQAPRDIGRQITTVDPAKLQNHEVIQLVSGTDDINDLAVVSAARREDVDYVLRGQVLHRNQSGELKFDPREPLVVSWRLISVADNRHVGGNPISVELKSAIETYPDLALADPTQAMAAAAVREAYRMFAPSLIHDQVTLAVPYGMPGSKAVRRGNALAAQGRWGDATKIWQTALDKHPTQTAALHNLALAAAAAQDFSLAKELIRKAIRRQPTELNKQSLVWIERMQREYHQAFQLPDPPEGWFVTNSNVR